jgi:Zn-dependent protease with chaperone function
MNERDNRIIKIFEDLKFKGVIAKRRKLIPSKWIFGPFKSGILLYNTIFYDKTAEEQLSQIGDSELRFILLHEEGHKVNLQYFKPPFMVILSLALFPLLFLAIFDPENILMKYSFTCYSILFIIFSFKILKEPLTIDEYGSDEFASKILQENFKIDRPSEVINSAFMTFKRIYDENNKSNVKKPKHQWFISIISRIASGFFSYHPKMEDRVKNIQEKCDKRPKLNEVS